MFHWNKDKEPAAVEEAVKIETKRTVPPKAQQQTAATSVNTPSSRLTMPERPKTLEAMLVQEGAISPEQLQQALKVQQEKGGFLGQVLMDLRFIEDGSLTSFLAKQCQIPHLSLLDYLIDEEILNLIPKDVSIKYRVLAIDRLGKNLTVAMVNPLDEKALEEIRGICLDLRIKPILCANAHFEAVVEKFFGEKSGAGIGKEMPEVSASSFGFKLPEAENSTAQEISYDAAEAEDIEETEEKGLDNDTIVSSCFNETETEAEEKIESITPEQAVSGDLTLGDTTLMMRKMVTAMRNSMRDTYEVLCRRVELFRGLEPEIVAKIFAKGVTAEFNKGDYIFRKGDQCRELYVILSGEVRIEDSGKEIAILSQGDMFGEMALVSKEPRSACSIVVERTSLLALSDDIIHHILPPEASVQMLMNIVVTLSRRLRNANTGGDASI